MYVLSDCSVPRGHCDVALYNNKLLLLLSHAGAGCYADLAGGVSTTGDGEAFMRTCFSAKVVDNLQAGRLQSV